MVRMMKDSGVEWIGEIPESWNLWQGKYLYDITTGHLDVNAEDPYGDYPFFTCSMYPKKINQYSFDCEALLVAGNGMVGYTQYYKGKFDAYQRTYVLNNFKNITPFYLKHYLSGIFKMEAEFKSVGSVIEFIKYSDLSNFRICMPNLSEQQKIAEFLDDKCGAIDEIISKTEQSIEEYKKLKQSVITKAVTKGIRSNRPMQDSNIEWIGEIPTDWEIMKLKFVFEIKKDIAGKEGYTVLSITQTGIKPKNITSNEGQQASDYSKYQLVDKGDFAMNHMDLLTGWVDISKYDGVTSPDYRVFRLKKINNCDRYFLYMMQLCYLNKIFYGFGQGVSGFGRWRLPADMFLNFLIPIPPLDEQKEIADYLDEKCAEIDTLIEKKQQFLAEIANYKKSLIYEYVTGKKEVA